jgi:peptidoglycan/LPS O-acetylase OafA/YrhL
VLFGLTISIFAEKPIRILQSKVLTYLGNISYGIYMYHAIMMQFVGFLFLKFIAIDEIPNYFSIIIFNVLVLFSSIITAHLSYQYFESYFLNLKKKWLK